MSMPLAVTLWCVKFCAILSNCINKLIKKRICPTDSKSRMAVVVAYLRWWLLCALHLNNCGGSWITAGNKKWVVRRQLKIKCITSLFQKKTKISTAQKQIRWIYYTPLIIGMHLISIPSKWGMKRWEEFLDVVKWEKVKKTTLLSQLKLLKIVGIDVRRVQ